VCLCRERARAYGAAVAKIDKYYPNISRKRSRGDGSSNERSTASLSGGVISRTVPQGHLNADDTDSGPHREERTKNAVQNRRLRTSMTEVVACMCSLLFSFLHVIISLFLLNSS
jgi:hypothetical protein